MSRKRLLFAISLLLVPLELLAQHSPAPAGPAEGPRMVGAPPPPGVAPGVHPPAPSEGSRFAPGPPPTTGTAGPGEVLPGQRRSPSLTTTPGAAIRTPTPTPARRRNRPRVTARSVLPSPSPQISVSAR